MTASTGPAVEGDSNLHEKYGWSGDEANMNDTFEDESEFCEGLLPTLTSEGNEVEIQLEDIGAYRELSGSTPVDHYNSIYFCFVMCGAGVLFPYNTFITAIDYFEKEYPSVGGVDYYFAALNLATNFLATCLAYLFIDKFSTYSRIVFGYFICLVTLSLVPVFQYLLSKGQISHDQGLYLVFVLVSIQGMGTGLQQGSFYGMAAEMPSRYIRALATGESVAGVTVSAVRIGTKLVFSGSENETEGLRLSTYLYFSLCTLVVLICIGCHEFVRRSEIGRFYCVGRSKRDSFLDSDMSHSMESVVLMTAEGKSMGNDGLGKMPLSESSTHSLARVLYTIKWPALAVFTVCFVTLSSFPGVVTQIPSQTLGDWFPIILIAVYNVADLVGKVLSKWHPSSITFLLIAVFGRVVFVPLIILCAAPPGENVEERTALYLEGEGWGVVLTFLLALSSGYFCSVALMEGPKRCSRSEQEASGLLMTVFLLFGLVAGSSFALVLKLIINSYK
eukprot:Nk52_evm63s1810 gene=Nk52_evmTU63s1810